MSTLKFTKPVSIDFSALDKLVATPFTVDPVAGSFFSSTKKAKEPQTFFVCSCCGSVKLNNPCCVKYRVVVKKDSIQVNEAGDVIRCVSSG